MATYLARCRFTRSGLGTDAAYTTHHLDNPGDGGSPLNAQLVAEYVEWLWRGSALISPAPAAAWGGLVSYVGNDHTLDEIQVYGIGVQSEPLATHPPDPALPGTSSSAKLPWESAICVNEFTATPRRTGRFYIPGVTTLHGARQMLTSARDAILTTMRNWHIWVRADSSFDPVLFSPTLGTAVEILEYGVDTDWDVMRSRGVPGTEKARRDLL